MKWWCILVLLLVSSCTQSNLIKFSKDKGIAKQVSPNVDRDTSHSNQNWRTSSKNKTFDPILSEDELKNLKIKIPKDVKQNIIYADNEYFKKPDQEPRKQLGKRNYNDPRQRDIFSINPLANAQSQLMSCGAFHCNYCNYR